VKKVKLIKTPLLTVCIITYNHEKFIKQALDSVLNQITDFEWVILIADDFSNDNTRKIIAEYKEKYQDKIQLLLQEKNVGPAQNFTDLIKKPNSKYIAYLEGDDYWIDKHKLQEQINFLEINQNFSLVHTNVIALENGEETYPPLLKPWNSSNSEADLEFGLQRPLAFSGTTVFRKIDFNFFLNKKYKNVRAGDWAFWVILLLFGNAKFLNKPTAVYRIGVGVSLNKDWRKNFLDSAIFLFDLCIKAPKLNQKKILFKWALQYFIQYLKVKKRKI
jgi:glycosyltransferase involved in cell wall biosynthesis